MATITILERITENRVLLSWREAGRCNYTEQLWALRKVPKTVTCAMTGTTIVRGEKAFLPLGEPVNLGNYISQQAVLMPLTG